MTYYQLKGLKLNYIFEMTVGSNACRFASFHWTSKRFDKFTFRCLLRLRGFVFMKDISVIPVRNEKQLHQSNAEIKTGNEFLQWR